MEKIKIALSKLFYYCAIHPFIWVAYKLHRSENLSKEEKALSDKLAEANEEDKKAVEIEMLEKIKSLPPHLRAEFRELNISGLQFFLAAHAIELLLRRNLRLNNLGSGFGALLADNGSIYFCEVSDFEPRFMETFKYCNIQISQYTTIQEIMHVAKVDMETAVKIIWIIVNGLPHDCLIPNFWYVTETRTGCVLKELKK